MLDSCTFAKEDPRESWSPTIYAGESSSKSLTRDQGKDKISCEDKKFDEMFCVFDRDIQKMFQKCLAKKEADQAWAWFKGTKSDEEKKADGDVSGVDREERDEIQSKQKLDSSDNKDRVGK